MYVSLKGTVSSHILCFQSLFSHSSVAILNSIYSQWAAIKDKLYPILEAQRKGITKCFQDTELIFINRLHSQRRNKALKSIPLLNSEGFSLWTPRQPDDSHLQPCEEKLGGYGGSSSLPQQQHRQSCSHTPLQWSCSVKQRACSEQLLVWIWLRLYAYKQSM